MHLELISSFDAPTRPLGPSPRKFPHPFGSQNGSQRGNVEVYFSLFRINIGVLPESPKPHAIAACFDRWGIIFWARGSDASGPPDDFNMDPNRAPKVLKIEVRIRTHF